VVKLYAIIQKIKYSIFTVFYSYVIMLLYSTVGEESEEFSMQIAWNYLCCTMKGVWK
jgi:hypothetical protein